MLNSLEPLCCLAGEATEAPTGAGDCTGWYMCGVVACNFHLLLISGIAGVLSCWSLVGQKKFLEEQDEAQAILPLDVGGWSAHLLLALQSKSKQQEKDSEEDPGFVLPLACLNLLALEVLSCT